MLIPIGVLAAGSILAGFPFKELFAGNGVEEFFRESLKMHPHIIEDMEGIPEWIKFLPTVDDGDRRLRVLRVLYPPALYAGRTRPPAPMLYQFLLNKWYFDELYDLIFVRPTQVARPLPVEGRRRQDHRRLRARRRVGAGA